MINEPSHQERNRNLYDEYRKEQDALIFRKSYSLADTTAPEAGPLLREQVRRMDDVVTYYQRLVEADVRVPSMRSTFRHAKDGISIIYDSEYLRDNRNCLVQIAEAPTSDKKILIALACLEELIKIAKTLESNRPVGYDAGIGNFVYSEIGQCAYAVDFYPPRLGYVQDHDGAVHHLAWEALLVNYPEMEPLDPARETRLRKSYYSPVGLLNHLFAWSVGAMFISDKSADLASVLQSDLFFEFRTRFLQKVGQQAPEYFVDLHRRLQDEDSLIVLHHRLLGAKERYQKFAEGDIYDSRSGYTFQTYPKYEVPPVHSEHEIAPAKSTSTLILAAGGKGSRLSGRIKPLEPVLDSRPLIEHILERIGNAHEVKRIILVGSNDTSTAQKTYEHLLNFDFKDGRPDLHLVIGKRSGVTEAFYRGLREALDVDRNTLLWSVGDTLVKDYGPLNNDQFPIMLGVSPNLPYVR